MNKIRIPSLHISKTDLSKILNEILGDADITTLVNQIFLKARKYALTHRSLLDGQQRLARKRLQIQSSTQADALLFSETLFLYRQGLKQKGVSRIKVGSKDWLIIKESAASALQFAEDFNLPSKEAFTLYISISMSKMNKFNNMKLPSMYSAVCEAYEAMQVIQSDGTSNLTQIAHKTYRGLVYEHTNLDFDYTKLPEKYVFFIKAKDIAMDLGLSPDTYIRAQFEGMKFRNGIPDPAQLIGDKALERVKNYLYENNMSLNKTTKSGIDFTKLKHLK